MPTSRAEVSTENGSKYLQQLCKHWAHKFAVEGDALHGRIDLGEGRLCVLDASAESLAVEATAAREEDLPRLREVIADHLRRFAFREDLAFDWR